MAVLAERGVEVHGGAAVPPLENGDHLDQPTFHERYAAMPADTRAELIGGTVYMASPVRRKHGKHTAHVVTWLVLYESETRGVEVFDNATAILAEDGEAQPDAALLIGPDFGGQTRTADDYIVGAPELVVEVASATESYDLHLKLHAYERAGVREYVVVVLRQQQILWFVNRGTGFEAMEPGVDQLYRSEVFPGLWLDPAALLRLDSKAVRSALEQGLVTTEHQEFVQRLAAAGEANG
jgi:Uma2 family endonuclease